MFSKKALFLPSLVGLLIITLTSGAMGSDPTLVRIGYQKYGTLNIVRAQGDLEKALTQKGKKVHWFLFTAGPQLLEALNAGVIDVGNTGEAPRSSPRWPTLLWSTLAINRPFPRARPSWFQSLPLSLRSPT